MVKAERALANPKFVGLIRAKWLKFHLNNDPFASVRDIDFHLEPAKSCRANALTCIKQSVQLFAFSFKEEWRFGQQSLGSSLKFYLLPMKAKHLLLISVIAALPVLAAMAEDTGPAEAAKQQTTSDVQNKPGAGQDQMLCKGDRTDTDLDTLLADMNSATSDKKLDAIVAVVSKLAEEFKAAQQKTETKTATSDKSEMDMCKMMMGMKMKDSGDNQEGDHEHHH